MCCTSCNPSVVKKPQKREGQKKSRMLEVHINICPSGFVDKCSTAIISTLSSTDCKGGNIETNETNPRDYLKDPPVDFDNDIEPTSEVKAYTNDFKDPCVNFDVEIEPASEVKVYTNEYEEEEGLLETEFLPKRYDSIEDIISGLINESERCKDARTGGQLAFARNFLHEDTLHQYLLNQQAASYALLAHPSYYENGLTRGSTIENLSNCTSCFFSLIL